MKRATVDRIVAVGYAAVDFVVVLIPAVVLKLSADRGGMGDLDGVDLLVASGVLAGVHAAVAGARLRSEARMAFRRADMWIAAVDAVVVLTLAATLLPMVVLWGLADEQASMADRGFPVVALWLGVQAVAVGLAELTGRYVFWWLEPYPRRAGSWRRSIGRTRRAGRTKPTVRDVDTSPAVEDRPNQDAPTRQEKGAQNTRRWPPLSTVSVGYLPRRLESLPRTTD